MRISRDNPLQYFVGVQLLAGTLAALPLLVGMENWPLGAFVFSQAALATLLARHVLWWWRWIHALFLPLALLTLQLPVTSGWFLLGFGLLWVVYGRTDRTRVPLYLSNTPTVTALAPLLAPWGTQLRFLDIGSGIGSVILPLAHALPYGQFYGIEHAWLPYWCSRWRQWHAGNNVHFSHGDFWTLDCQHFNVVYAFLSPVPMAALWQKLQQELPNGACLISNSFVVPDVPPDLQVVVQDRRQTVLYVWRVNRTTQ